MELRVCYVDDSNPLLVGIKHKLEREQVELEQEQFTFHVETFQRIPDFYGRLNSLKLAKPDIFLLDAVMYDDADAGLNLALEIRRRSEDAVIIIFSQFDDASTIAQHMAGMGIDNFLSKTTSSSDLAKNLLRSYVLARKKKSLQGAALDSTRPAEKFVGKFHAKLAQRVPHILHSAVRSVHVVGETGTGKEVVADIFAAALDGQQPFIRVNCGAFAPTILESELFGYKKGAFTGAQSDKIGLLEAASGGWIFLDEVALLSTQGQIALLRALENQEIIRLGDNVPRKINVKVLSATNQNLSELVHAGQFRQDLWQRLMEIEIALPPLRERLDEVEPLARFFAAGMEEGPYEIPPTTIEVFKRYSWSNGNVRELRNCLRAMTELHTNKVLEPGSIPLKIYSEISKVRSKPPASVIAIPINWDDISYENLEEQLFLQLLTEIVKRNRIDSMRSLERLIGVPRTTLTNKIRKLVDSGKLSPAKLPLDLQLMRKQGGDEAIFGESIC